MNKLEIVRNELILGGFSDLDHLEIRVRYASIKSDYLTCQELDDDLWQVEAAHCLKYATLDQLTGGLCHEFAHMVRDLRKRKDKRTKANERYWKDKKYRRFDERETDRLGIRRGYGSEILRWYRYAEKRGEEIDTNYNLSEKEIREYIRRMYDINICGHHQLTLDLLKKVA